MSLEFEEYRLDDVGTDPALDPGGLLRQAASAGAQVRQAASAASEAGLSALAEEGRPRSVVVVGTGAAAFAGEVLAVLLGNGCPVAVHTVEGYRLPGWVGGHDLVIAVAATSGQESAGTARVAAEAVRRGSRFLAVGPQGGPLAGIAEQARAPYVALPLAGEPRAMLWALVVPLLLAVGRIGVRTVPEEDVEATAVLLEDVAHRCRPTAETFANPAKSLALSLAGTLPMAWGATPVAALAARRLASQLAANARYPALAGSTPGIAWDQTATLTGPLGASGPRSIFDDPVEGGGARLRLVLLRDDQATSEEDADLAAAERRAEEAGVPVSEVSAQGRGPMERLASLIALTDYASLYLAVAYAAEPLTNTLVVR
ncbi:SIS domain-containing protein [Actinorugispora endophytica]|uniref:Glucose/mannose-6-phosphate isomerase n=1 Tax=Actinorugispora endophytica TaxID=1605990 RepID=A0A4R6V034_9ACTN|nr:SIS domain-containing protein [Actinorugispora endophytica]TDQ51946.1 glucose/mannose-6-phosphate isomerase [Actinorugispora endophytica]